MVNLDHAMQEISPHEMRCLSDSDGASFVRRTEENQPPPEAEHKAEASLGKKGAENLGLRLPEHVRADFCAASEVVSPRFQASLSPVMGNDNNNRWTGREEPPQATIVSEEESGAPPSKSRIVHPDKDEAEVKEAKRFEQKVRRWKGFVQWDKSHLLTSWGEKLDPAEQKYEYPRPCMVRNQEQWVCLNGFWDYAVTKTMRSQPPESFDGDILVPFPVESTLSGVQKRITKDNFLWYKRLFALPDGFDREESRLLLHFGAVDWQAIVYVNGQAVGEHCGGYDPFKFDVTPHLDMTRAQQEVVVRVYDPTDEGLQPRGKQCSDPLTSTRVVAPLGMWYTPVSGIWQTVWLETVPRRASIESIKIAPNIDDNSVQVTVNVNRAGEGKNEGLLVKMLSGMEVVGFATKPVKQEGESTTLTVRLSEDHQSILWTPDNPFLYDLEIYLHDNSHADKHDAPIEPIDMVKSYAAMRKISIGPDENGAVRFHLNNKQVFQYGILDQGWWPDGLYAAPCDEALRWDVETIKNMGFNMIRKHVKVEPERWYHHCDKLGMLVWQDMPNGSVPAKWAPGGAYDYQENPANPLFAKIFEDELKACVDALRNYPCITSWVPFNEAWGQYNSVEVVKWLEKYDPTRLVWVSGGNDFGVGSAIDRHVYPQPIMPPLDNKRVAVLGEFGGLGHTLDGHTWSSSSDSWDESSEDEEKPRGDTYSSFVEWGYNQVQCLDTLAQDYLNMLEQLQNLSMGGLGAAVYTQFSDVERESNGLVTYDRRMVKLDMALLRKAHRRLMKSSNNSTMSLSHLNMASLVQETVKGLPRSHTFTGLANMHCVDVTEDHEEKKTKIPRCTSLSSLFISTN